MYREKKLYKVFLSLCLVIFMLKGCVNRSPKAKKLLPKRPNVLLFLKINQIAKDRDLSRALNLRELERELAKSNIALGEVKRTVVFMDSSSKKYLGMILERDNTKSKIQLPKGRWRKERYSRDDYYYNSASDECIASIGSRTLVFGTEEAVKDVLDVYRGRAESQDLQPTYKELTESIKRVSPPVTGYFIISQRVLDMQRAGLEAAKTVLNFLDLGIFSAILRKISLVEGFRISIEHQGNVFPTEMLCLMESEKAASLISGSINLLKSISSAVPKGEMRAQQKQSFKAFESMKVSRESRALKIKMTIPRSEFLRR